MASELIFAAAYPARVAIPIETASVRHRNGDSGPRIFERHNRSGFGRNWKHDAGKQCKRENFFHSVFPDALQSDHPAARLCSSEFDPRLYDGRCQSTRIFGAPGLRMESTSLHKRDRIKNESPQTSARLGNRCER